MCCDPVTQLLMMWPSGTCMRESVQKRGRAWRRVLELKSLSNISEFSICHVCETNTYNVFTQTLNVLAAVVVNFVVGELASYLHVPFSLKWGHKHVQ